MRRLLLAAASIALVSCTPADLTQPSPPPKPVPTKGTLEFATVPANIPGTMCLAINANGDTVIRALAPKIVSDSLVPGRHTPKCKAPGWKEGEGSTAVIDTGRHTVATVPMEKEPVTSPPPPPLDSNAVIRLELEDGSTGNVDKREKFPLAGAPVVTNIGLPTPFQESVKVDGAAYAYTVSKAGYAKKRVDVEPVPRQVNLILVRLTPLPTVASDSGILGCASSPPGMLCKVYRSGTSTLVTSGTTFFERKLQSGSYTLVCEDPTGARVSDTAFVYLPAGSGQTGSCENPEKPQPEDPPPPVEPNIGTLTTVCRMSGVRTTVILLRTNAVVGTGMGPADLRLAIAPENYLIRWEDTQNRYLPDSIPVGVNKGQFVTEGCVLREIPLPPPPTPPTEPQYCEAKVRFGSWKYVGNTENWETNLLRNHTAIDPGFIGPVQIRLQLISLRADKTDRFAISRRNPLTGARVDFAKRATGDSVSVDPDGVTGIRWIDAGSFPSWSELYDLYLEHGSRHVTNQPQPWNVVEVEGMELIGRRRCTT